MWPHPLRRAYEKLGAEITLLLNQCEECGGAGVARYDVPCPECKGSGLGKGLNDDNQRD